MKFFVIVILLGSGTKITYKFNKHFFISEYQYATIIGNRPQKTIIDFGAEIIYSFSVNDVIDSTSFDLELFQKDTFSELTDATIIQKEFFHHELGYECERIELTLNREFNVNDTSVISSGKYIKALGEVPELMNYLPDKNYLSLLKGIFSHKNIDHKFNICFDYKKKFQGKETSLVKIVEITIEEGDKPSIGF